MSEEIDKNKLIEEIRGLENTYPKDIFGWDNKEECSITKGRLNQFLFQVVENTRRKIIDLVEEQEIENE